ncbi:MAG: helix-turn-helix domain-containing protein [Bellilinea sp.]
MLSSPKSKNWLNLTEAAERLGVHFTTLRRWADAGIIEYIRTPGGIRRFTPQALDSFIESRQHGMPSNKLTVANQVSEIVHHKDNSIEKRQKPWMTRLSEDQRNYLRGTGNRLMALIMQYSSRVSGGDIYLEEGRKISREYGDICFQVGMSISETVGAFLMYRRPILEVVHDTSALNGVNDAESVRIYQKTMFFLDDILTAMVEQYNQHQYSK